MEQVGKLLGHLAELPDTPIAIGDTWTTSVKHALGQAANVGASVENKLLSVEGSKVTIDFRYRFDLDNDAPQGAPPKRGTTAAGNYVLDLRDALAQSSDMKLKFVTASKGPGPGVWSCEMTMDMKIRTTDERKDSPRKQRL